MYHSTYSVQRAVSFFIAAVEAFASYTAVNVAVDRVAIACRNAHYLGSKFCADTWCVEEEGS